VRFALPATSYKDKLFYLQLSSAVKKLTKLEIYVNIILKYNKKKLLLILLIPWECDSRQYTEDVRNSD